MDVLTLAMWIGTAIFLIFSFTKDKKKTKQALKMAFGMGKGMLGSILSIIFLIGLILTVFPPENIAEFVGKQSVFSATVIAAAFGGGSYRDGPAPRFGGTASTGRGIRGYGGVHQPIE